ncbi:MAG: response regulator [Candidatus Omnitrophica bacterium]|nr:response regulator [Candidatus Omnitrophota bacterium]
MAETRSKRILIIEDDENLASSLRRLLMLEGFDVELQASGAMGLVQAAERPPDLVILDLKLPDVHGYQVCRELRKLHGSWTVPILMLTGMDQPIDQLRGYAHGADAYLTKPCQSQELLKTIKLLIGQLSLA